MSIFLKLLNDLSLIKLVFSSLGFKLLGVILSSLSIALIWFSEIKFLGISDKFFS